MFPGFMAKRRSTGVSVAPWACAYLSTSFFGEKFRGLTQAIGPRTEALWKTVTCVLMVQQRRNDWAGLTRYQASFNMVASASRVKSARRWYQRGLQTGCSLLEWSVAYTLLCDSSGEFYSDVYPTTNTHQSSKNIVKSWSVGLLHHLNNCSQVTRLLSSRVSTHSEVVSIHQVNSPLLDIIDRSNSHLKRNSSALSLLSTHRSHLPCSHC